MKGRSAEIKALGEALLAVWAARVDNTSVAHRHHKCMLRHSARLDQMIQERRDLTKYPKPIFREFLATCGNYLVLRSALATHYSNLGIRVSSVAKSTAYCGNCVGPRDT